MYSLEWHIRPLNPDIIILTRGGHSLMVGLFIEAVLFIQAVLWPAIGGVIIGQSTRIYGSLHIAIDEGYRN